ncbi:hypothetical protein B7494_g1968 [Chlorociboria aeruginascens]|nr:hypothetical protein B7494_g1968 [Chlorociboria aeruginascens]
MPSEAGHRLYAKARHFSYQRGKRNTNPLTSLVKIEGVDDSSAADFYLGKKVAYVYRATREKRGSKIRVIWGKVTRRHGNSGVVRAKFRKPIPAETFGKLTWDKLTTQASRPNPSRRPLEIKLLHLYLAKYIHTREDRPGQQRVRAQTSFSYKSNHSHKSSDGGKIDLHETHEEKAQRIIKTKADPSMAINEAEPAMVAAQEKSQLAPIRAIQHRDSQGNPIADPDRSNPTRSRWERPLDTIRSFEAAIEGSEVTTNNRRSSYFGDAREYGTADASWGFPAHKSGLTPLSPLYPLAQGATRDIRNKLERYQRSRLHGFTTLELNELDALTNRDLKPNDLNNPIHPAFRRDRWLEDEVAISRKIALYPITIPGMTGTFNAHNPVVWHQLEPCLRLVSHILARIYQHPLFDALLFGDVRDIHESRFSAEDKLKTPLEELQTQYKTFHLRPVDPSNAQNTLRELDRINDILKVKLNLIFGSESKDPGGKDVRDAACGLTMLRAVKGDIYISLAHEEFESLLRTDLTSSRRLAEQFTVAMTLTHEFMHAVGYVKRAYNGSTYRGSHPSNWWPEHYFETQQLSEWGASLNGGLIQPMIERPVVVGFFVDDWPTDDDDSGPPVLINPSMSTTLTLHPIPVTHFETLGAQAFWDSIFRNFGMLRVPYPLVSSTKIRHAPTDWTLSVPGQDPAPYHQRSDNQLISQALNMSRDQLDRHRYTLRLKCTESFANSARKRELQAHKVMAQGDYYFTSLNQQEQYTRLNILIKLIHDFITLYSESVALVAALEAPPQTLGISFVDTRNSLIGLGRNLRTYVISLNPVPFRDLSVALSHQELRIENIRQALTTPDSVQISADGDITASAQAELDDEAAMTYANTQLAAGNHADAARICRSLAHSFGPSTWLRTQAFLMLGLKGDIERENIVREVVRI